MDTEKGPLLIATKVKEGKRCPCVLVDVRHEDFPVGTIVTVAIRRIEEGVSKVGTE